MKVKTLLMTILTSLMMFASAFTVLADDATYIDINETNFPDAIFREYVSTNFDSDGDDKLSETEVASAIRVNLAEETELKDLTGIEYLKNLQYLYCNDTGIESFDVSNNTALKLLHCYNTGIKNIDVSKNTALTQLFCEDTGIESLDVSKNTALEWLFCYNTEIESLNVSNNTALTFLNCEHTRIESLDVSKNTALTKLHCCEIGIESLDVSKNTALEILYCHQNGIKSLDVSKNTALQVLCCIYTEIESLDVSNNTSLKELSTDVGNISCCYDFSNITGFDVSKASDWTGATYKDGKVYVSDETFSCTYTLASGETGTYKFYATELTHDYANGICGDCGNADGNSGTPTTPDDKNEIKDVLNDSTADTIIEDIEEIGLEEMADAMQNDSDVLDRIESIEAEYTKANNVTVKEVENTHSAFKDAEINVVGAGFNVTSGSSIQVKFDEVSTENKKDVDEDTYENIVQVSITLNNDDEKVTGTLSVPIAITMKLPEGVKSDKLVILHYHADGTMEKISPVINGDGTITFTVTSFSTFVFANEAEDEEPVTPAEPVIPEEPDDNEDNDEDTLNRMLVEMYWHRRAGWQMIRGDWYYFDENGSLMLGWVCDTDGRWYYMNNNGKMAAGWVKSPASGLWYYMNPDNGDMLADCWVCDPNSSRWYYLNENGAMCTSWIMVDGKWYLLDMNGAMCTGWNIVDGEWYFLGADGAMLTGWQVVGDKEYYFDESGKCLINTTTPDGAKVDETGAKIKQ